MSWGVAAVHTAKDEGFCSPAPNLVLCPYIHCQPEASSSAALIKEILFLDRVLLTSLHLGISDSSLYLLHHWPMTWALRIRKEGDKHLLNPLKCQTPGLTSHTPSEWEATSYPQKAKRFLPLLSKPRSYIQATPLIINVLWNVKKNLNV